MWLKTEVLAFVNTAMNLWVSQTERKREREFYLKLSVAHINTLWTGDADLRFYITTVQDG